MNFHFGPKRSYSMLRYSASGLEIGLLGRILAGLLPGKHQNRPSGRPSAGRKAAFGAFPVAVRPKSGPKSRVQARLCYSVWKVQSGPRSRPLVRLLCIAPFGFQSSLRRRSQRPLGYLKAVWPDFGGVLLRSGRPPVPGKALKTRKIEDYQPAQKPCIRNPSGYPIGPHWPLLGHYWPPLVRRVSGEGPDYHFPRGLGVFWAASRPARTLPPRP